ncbi:cellulose synthase catalytic subunit (UDP-forming) [Mariprofundus sp. EBB-1]|uniref:UDP-forming cellulose synthase catalytic subunit n=1 Tax=Mariprofundus sp. EBB-1 TaxID=2650971 RepID=UPI000EF18D68|nr:UDP-forming cellulose synthase catalytic subunit [Mariprofundus sp. EBB-1]RLL56038.1 cellulose synthase catalytic subunit (UDP-forming) [Mariprofundus sp. EBB-1]
MIEKFHLATLGAVWLVLAGLMLYLASLDVLPEVQLFWTVSAVLIMIVIRFNINRTALTSFNPLYFGRLLIVLLTGMIALRYMWWRTFHSIPLDADFYSMIGGLILYVAEIQATIIFFVGSFVYIAPRKRDVEPVSLNEADLPTVDVFVPTYNESAEISRLTLLACTNLQYPSDKLNIYMLDDGGTVQFRNHSDPVKARSAQDRHETFKALCDELGVHYLTREKNIAAKAGNINAALKHTSGDLVVIFDCDHVPTVDFLQNTVSHFMKDEKLWLVQTPHFLINDDPIEKNTRSKADMPSECELFYTSAMRGMDNWNAAFFCGSGGVLRRSCLETIGGICTETVTEDIETSVEMHAKGFNSVYLHRPMLAGLQPETFTGFLTQRLRWAHGMLQVFMMKNPLLIKGLSFWQRICYFNMTYYWFFAFMRLIFLFSPVLYLIFGIRLYDAPVEEILIYGLPHLVAFAIYFNVFFGRSRWFLVSDMYEVLQSFFAIRTIFQVVLHPQRGTFMVTPKDENIMEDFISPVAKVFHLAVGIMAVTVAVGMYRIFILHGPTLAMDITVTVWAVLSSILLVGSVGVLHETKQVRSTTRFSAKGDVVLHTNAGDVVAKMVDLSSKGIGMLASGTNKLSKGDKVTIKVFCQVLDKELELNAHVCAYFPVKGNPGIVNIGLNFEPQSVEEERMIVAFAYGNSERWRETLKARNVHHGLYEGAHYFSMVCLPLGIKHIYNQILRTLAKVFLFIKPKVKENV